ncbi:MAG TPA: FAD-dependent oxidoreductase [Pyrinomonadaceae bacterium]|nr:FAD-dependent oxidoreductase [Pyrinomonadaceae bacterium]
MANVLILGGGFGGVICAERLAESLSREHHITLVARDDRFLFYPALVRLAFGRARLEDISYDLREAMLDARVRFVQAEVARVDVEARLVTLARGEVAGEMSYDYLVIALGRRLATERVRGFYEYAHHMLTLEAAQRFGHAVKDLHRGHAVIGYCSGARLAVPAYETAFAVARELDERGEREHARITLVSPEPPGDALGGPEMASALKDALAEHRIEFLPDFAITQISPGAVATEAGRYLNYDLLMLVPPFHGPGALASTGLTDEEGYVTVDEAMRVRGAAGVYAVGDCVSLPGPKMGHMAVNQAEVAARNLAAELEGKAPDTEYRHEMMLVVDEGGRDSLYFHKALWDEEAEPTVRRGRFWSWAKRVHERYWISKSRES